MHLLLCFTSNGEMIMIMQCSKETFQFSHLLYLFLAIRQGFPSLK